MERVDEEIPVFQRGWRGFHKENRNRAATVIQTAWRISLKRTEYLSQQGDGKNMIKNRPGRQRYTT